MSRKIEHDSVSEGALEAIETKRMRQKAEELDREKKEQLIAETFRMMGRIESARMFEKLGSVSSLIWLKQVKETRIYMDILGMRSWESFCNYLGISRQKVDKDLLNLRTFGEEFLLTVSSFKVGYRDLDRLRRSVTDGEINIDSEGIELDGEKIPFDEDHKEDLQAAIERVLERKDEEVQKQQKELKKRERLAGEEVKGLKTERDALVKENQRLKVFDPSAQGDKDLDWCKEQMAEIHMSCRSFTTKCRLFMKDNRLEGDIHRQAQVEVLMIEADKALRELKKSWYGKFMPREE